MTSCVSAYVVPSATWLPLAVAGVPAEGPEVHPPVVRTGMLVLDFPGSGLIETVIAFNTRNGSLHNER